MQSISFSQGPLTLSGVPGVIGISRVIGGEASWCVITGIDVYSIAAVPLATHIFLAIKPGLAAILANRLWPTGLRYIPNLRNGQLESVLAKESPPFRPSQ